MQEPENPTQPIQSESEPPKSDRRALMIIFLVVFIDLLGFGLVIPLLPALSDNFISREANNATRGLIIGLLFSSFSLMQFVFAPIWGRISDRVGRRPILLLGLGGSAVFYALFGFAFTFSPIESAGIAIALLFVARIGAGIAGATIPTAQAAIADSTPKEKRKHGMALIGAAFGIGFTFGPLVGILTLTIFPGNPESIGYTAAILSGLALLLGIRLLPETRKFGAEPTLKRKWLDTEALRHAFANPAVGPVVLTFFLATMGFAAFESTLALLLKTVIGFESREMLWVFAFIGVVLLITQGYIYRKLADRLSEVTFMVLGILLMGLGVVGLGGVSWGVYEGYSIDMLMWTALYGALIAAVVGFAFLTPSSQALISRRTGADKQGEVLGLNQSASAMARILGPVIGATLFWATPSHMLPYLFGGGILLLMLPMMPRVRRGEAVS